MNFTIEEKLSVLESITFEDVAQFTDKWLVKTHLEWFCYGNLLPEACKKLSIESEILIKTARKNTQLLEKLPQVRFYKVPVNKNFVYEEILMNKENFKPNNSGISKIYFEGQ